MSTGENFEAECPYRSDWEVLDVVGKVHVFYPDWASYQSAKDEAAAGQNEVLVSGRWKADQNPGHVKFTNDGTGWIPLKATDQ